MADLEEGDEASGGSNQQEVPLADDELNTLQSLLSKLGARPKTESKEDLRQWIAAANIAQLPASTANTTVANFTAPAKQSASSGTSSGPSGQGIYVSSAASAVPTVVNVLGRKPWLMKFSGDDGYDLWRHQLLSLIQERHRPQDLADAIRASLQGKAAALLISLGPLATVEAILVKLDSVYGQVDDNADVMASFFSARQGPTESVADWSCRIEGLFSRLRRLSGTAVSTEDLRQMFWTGLRQELKDASSYHYETIKNFDELRIALRRIEKQHPPPPQPPPSKPGRTSCHAVQKDQNPDVTETLIAMVKQLSKEFQTFKKESTARTEARRPPPFTDQHSSSQPFGPNTHGNNPGNYVRGRGEGQPPRGRGGRGQGGPIFCHKCGESGHIAIGCRVNTDFV
jgi:hypothetical protein